MLSHTFLVVFACLALAYILVKVEIHTLRRRAMPYQWRCLESGCGFRVTATHPGGMRAVRDQHIEHHKEGINGGP